MSKKIVQKIIPNYKIIHDSIHGYIGLSNIMVMVIDFQTVSKIKEN